MGMSMPQGARLDSRAYWKGLPGAGGTRELDGPSDAERSVLTV